LQPRFACEDYFTGPLSPVTPTRPRPPVRRHCFGPCTLLRHAASNSSIPACLYRLESESLRSSLSPVQVHHQRPHLQPQLHCPHRLHRVSSCRPSPPRSRHRSGSQTRPRISPRRLSQPDLGLPESRKADNDSADGGPLQVFPLPPVQAALTSPRCVAPLLNSRPHRNCSRKPRHHISFCFEEGTDVLTASILHASSRPAQSQPPAQIQHPHPQPLAPQ
jgi:hypothetical protein